MPQRRPRSIGSAPGATNLVHDDDRARERLPQYVAAGTETDHLTADMARDVITRMDAVFTDIVAN